MNRQSGLIVILLLTTVLVACETRPVYLKGKEALVILPKCIPQVTYQADSIEITGKAIDIGELSATIGEQKIRDASTLSRLY